MGVPALFRWLSQKYPKIISQVVEEQPREIDGVTIPVDITQPNPNNEEFDNLYLDMNGIVHPCSHPEDRPAPANEEEMMLEIFKYTERVVNMVRPRKLLMMAVDGVAPRAKMNQQRSRRFRSAQEAREKDEDKAEFLKLLKSRSGGVDADFHAEATKKTWDSNAITPGTPFMDILAASLRYWVAYKLNTDPGWKNLKVIISDATVPGEGEHKIMEFVRSQRRSPEHDPNTRHVIYGLDADLIMLGLATHEPHFRVLREDVFFDAGKPRTCKLCGQPGHMAEQCRGEAKKKVGEFDEKSTLVQKPFIWLHVSILREYLAVELNVPNQPFKFDLERALDDWVFMCFFVGNDFLPHLPSLDIREQGIDTLMAIWRDNIPIMGGYVTKDGHVDLEKAQLILQGLAKQEDAIFKRRRETEERKERNAKRRKLEQEARNGSRNGGNYGNASTPTNPRRVSAKTEAEGMLALPDFDPRDAQSREVLNLSHDMFVNRKALFQAQIHAQQANKSAAAVLKETLLKRNSAVGLDEGAASNDTSAPDTPASGDSPMLGKRKADLMEDDSSTPGRNTPMGAQRNAASSDEPPPDTVRLWEEGYADRYYEQKFHVDPKNIEFRHQVARCYVEGLCWVLLYYFQGCPSWTWYYPYHYSPFAADFVELGKMKIEFTKGQPFRPYEQLMGVMPAASRHTLPEVFHDLMTSQDSEIIDFYPEQFQIDLNGKKFAWQGVALLPFIDETRLLDAMAKKYPLLTSEEHRRNSFGQDVLLFSTHHPLSEHVITNLYSKKAQGAPKVKLNPRISDGLSGKIEKSEEYVPGTSLVFPLSSEAMPNIDEDQSISVYYEMPTSTHIHKSMLLRGVNLPVPALDQRDIDITQSKARKSGRSYGGAPLRNDQAASRNGPRNGGENWPGRGAPINYSNPFAAFINPQFGPPPPHMAAASGWVPPPPFSFPPGMPPTTTAAGDFSSKGGASGGYLDSPRDRNYGPSQHTNGPPSGYDRYDNRQQGRREDDRYDGRQQGRREANRYDGRQQGRREDNRHGGRQQGRREERQRGGGYGGSRGGAYGANRQDVGRQYDDRKRHDDRSAYGRR